MLKLILGVIAGLVAWFVAATLLNLGLRFGLPGYRSVEAAMAFTLPMQVLRLAIGLAASIAAGVAAARVAGAASKAPWILVVALLALFLPVHYQLWQAFPFWYHATFIVSLVAGTLVGARLQRAPAAPAAA